MYKVLISTCRIPGIVLMALIIYSAKNTKVGNKIFYRRKEGGTIPSGNSTKFIYSVSLKKGTTCHNLFRDNVRYDTYFYEYRDEFNGVLNCHTIIESWGWSTFTTTKGAEIKRRNKAIQKMPSDTSSSVFQQRGLAHYETLHCLVSSLI